MWWLFVFLGPFAVIPLAFLLFLKIFELTIVLIVEGVPRLLVWVWRGAEERQRERERLLARMQQERERRLAVQKWQQKVAEEWQQKAAQLDGDGVVVDLAEWRRNRGRARRM